MEGQSEQLPRSNDDLQEWNRIFAENNQKMQVLMAGAIRLLEEQTQQRNAAGTH